MPSTRFLGSVVLALLFVVGCGAGPSEEAEALLARGDSALNLLGYSEAARLYGEAAELDPDLAEAYSRQGLALWAAQQFERALPVLDRAIELDPEDARAHYFRGASFFSLNRFEEALPDLKTAASLGTLDIEDVRRAHHLRFVALTNLERYDEAETAISEAIETVPDLAFYYLERARLHDFSGQTDAAIGDYTAFLERGGDGDLAAEAEQRLAVLRGETPSEPSVAGGSTNN